MEERVPPVIAQYHVDGGYLPGGDESAELAQYLTTATAVIDFEEHPEEAEELIDASIFTSMLHP